VAAGFDAFAPELIDTYFPYGCDYLRQLGIALTDLLSLGRQNPQDPHEPFTMAYLALRGCAMAHGASRLHGVVSRRLFTALYPRWPEHEVPIGYITNGVHAPSWDSPWADRLVDPRLWQGPLVRHGGAPHRRYPRPQ
jgi:glycogen phosphorylase